ncbi:hypothetical protein QE152_g23231 [Popillia japonica]|uniref:Uncharacterized protein n=1 Tax=Popillia japonica TaxID=7064 RepID=A0AAW1KG98_POPJA
MVQLLSDTEFEETFSSFLPEKSYGAIPGTSIIKRGHTPQTHKRVSWFSPGVHSSPTKSTSIIKRGHTPQTHKRVSWFSPGVHSSPTKSEKPKAQNLSKISETPRQVQPSFLEDEYIGEYLPETPVAPKDDEDESLGEFEDDR